MDRRNKNFFTLSYEIPLTPPSPKAKEDLAPFFKGEERL